MKRASAAARLPARREHGGTADRETGPAAAGTPGVLELIGIVLAGLAAGVLHARWWLVAVPPAVIAAWVGWAAAGGGENSDGMPDWQIALFLGGLVALAASLGVAAGVVWGGWLRDRR